MGFRFAEGAVPVSKWVGCMAGAADPANTGETDGIAVGGVATLECVAGRTACFVNFNHSFSG